MMEFLEIFSKAQSTETWMKQNIWREHVCNKSSWKVWHTPTCSMSKKKWVNVKTTFSMYRQPERLFVELKEKKKKVKNIRHQSTLSILKECSLIGYKYFYCKANKCITTFYSDKIWPRSLHLVETTMVYRD